MYYFVEREVLLPYFFTEVVLNSCPCLFSLLSCVLGNACFSSVCVCLVGEVGWNDVVLLVVKHM